MPIFDHRDRRKNGRKEYNQNNRAGEEILHVIYTGFIGGGKSRQPERCPEAGANQKPEQNRRTQRSNHATSLTEETDQFALPQRSGRQKKWPHIEAILSHPSVARQTKRRGVVFRALICARSFPQSIAPTEV